MTADGIERGGRLTPVHPEFRRKKWLIGVPSVALPQVVWGGSFHRWQFLSFSDFHSMNRGLELLLVLAHDGYPPSCQRGVELNAWIKVKITGKLRISW